MIEIAGTSFLADAITAGINKRILTPSNFLKKNDDGSFELPTSGIREFLDRLLHRQGIIIDADHDKNLSDVGKLPGFTIVREEKFNMESKQDCEWFVFHKESWWGIISYSWEDSWEEKAYRTEAYLGRHGYEKTTNPQEGDIAIYTGKNRRNETQTFHFGLYTPESGMPMVTSKWSFGPTMKHFIPSIPTFYGNRVYFMQKRKN